MNILLSLLLVTPSWAFSSEDELNYVRKRLREYNSRFNPKLQQKGGVEEHDRSIETSHFVKNHIKSIEEINMATEYADALFEGDIMLTREQVDDLLDGDRKYPRLPPGFPPNFTLDLFPKRKPQQKLWNRTISYRYHENLPENYKKYVQFATALYSKLTCLTFQENPSASKVLEFDHHPGCRSSLGFIPVAVQNISLGENCGQIGSAVHEIGHALGVIHTQSRHDRDDYVIVHSEKLGNFSDQYAKENTTTNNNFGIPYDYGSVMHYNRFAPHSDSEIAIEAKDRLYTWTMGSRLDSFYDMLMINKLYNCTVCTNGGYPNPNNCSVCLCPRGYAGRLCNEMPKDGQEVFLNPGTGVVTRTKFRETSEDRKIKITYHFVTEVGYECTAGCQLAGMEVKVQKDQKLTGYRFCCKEEMVVISNSSFVPVIIYHRKDKPMAYSFCAETVDIETFSTTQTATPSVPTTTNTPSTTTITRQPNILPVKLPTARTDIPDISTRSPCKPQTTRSHPIQTYPTETEENQQDRYL